MTLQKSLAALQSSGVILFPSDTVLGLGCNATDEEAVKKIFLIKNRKHSKSLVALVSDFEMLKEYVESIPKQVFDILDHASVPTTIVYPKAKQLAPMAMADDGSMAIRIPKSGFALDLVKSLVNPSLLPLRTSAVNKSQRNHLKSAVIFWSK